MSSVTPSEDFSKGVGADVSEQKRAIAYSMDLLIPGLYIWLGRFAFRLFGEKPEDTPYRYSGMLNRRYGVALILPSYRIFTTHKDSYDQKY